MRFRGENRGDQAGLALPVERPLSRGHLVQHSAEGEDVGTRIDLSVFDLLGRHVLERADDRSFLGQRFVMGGAVDLEYRRGLGQPEIEELRSRLGDHDVARLQIAVDDPRAMGFVESVGDLHAVAHDLLQRQRTLGDALRE